MRPEALYYCPELMLDPTDQTRVVDQARRDGVETVQVSRTAFERAAYREGPDGFIAVVPSVVRTCAELSVGPRALTVLCQGVEKPGNLGAMLRTADAAGAEAVIAADPVTDWGNPNLVRASKGTVFSVPVASDSTADTLAWLDAHGIALVATTPDTDLLHTDVDYTGPVAIAVGAEKYGLTAGGAGPRGIQGPDPDGGQGELAQRRHLGRHRHLRSRPPARRQPLRPAGH